MNSTTSSLRAEDYAALHHDSWIDSDTADAFGLYRVSSAEGAELVGRTDREDYAGIAFPIYGPGDDRPKEYILRRDHPPLDDHNGKPKPRQKYLAPPGRGNRLFFGPGESVEALADTTLPIVLVEGVKKTVAAWRLSRYENSSPRYLACGISGVWGWRGTIGKAPDPTGARVDIKGVISDIGRISWTTRTVYVLFDSDTVTNQKVLQARCGLVAELRRRGAIVLAPDLPRLEGQDKTGFDDLLAAWGPEQVLAWLASVQVESSTEPESTLDLSKALVNYRDLLTLNLPPRPRYLPWLPEGGNIMVFGPRGIGKTFFLQAVAASLATGKSLWKWECSAPVGVIYLDGEMQLDELRERATALMNTPPSAPLEFLTSQLVYQRCGGKDLILSSDIMRREVVKILDARPDIRVLILDNISCLFSGINEDSKQDWEPINAWLIRLRHRGISTILVHHAGKGGQQRGTSGREDSLDTVIQLSKPTGADAREGCHFELTFTKCRSVTGEDVAPLDVRLQTVNSSLQWVWQPIEVSKLDQARRLVAEGVSGPTELAEELGINKGYASRLLKKLKAEGTA
jgi:hypothetical protein